MVKFNTTYLLRVQVKIWFQNHRYKTKKALKDQNHAEHRTAATTASDTDRTLSPRTVAVPLLVKDAKKCSTEDDEDDWTRRSSTVDAPLSDQQELPLPLPLPAPPGAGFRSQPVDLRPGDALGYPTSMYVGGTQSVSSPTFLPTSAAGSVPGFQLAVDGYRARLDQVVAARPCSRSPVDSTPSPFSADAVLYGPRDTVTAAGWVGGSMEYYYPPYAAAANSASPSIDRTFSSPVGYLPVNSLRTW